MGTKEQNIKLWAAFRKGEESAFRSIFNSHVKAMYRYGLKFVSDEEMVKDCTQDLFVKLYKNRSNLGDTDNIQLYLFRALKNKLFDEMYSCKDTVSLSTPYLDFEMDRTAEPEEEETWSQTQRKNLLEKGMKVLTPRQREAIYLRYTMEMSLEDISKLLDMNYQSVKNLLHRSIEKLRKEVVFVTLLLLLLVI